MVEYCSRRCCYVELSIFLLTGLQHDVGFMCCSCEGLSVTLARARLWPATPANPKLAFTFELLNLVEAMMLECQVSLKDFCEALKFLCPLAIVNRREVYPVVIDSFEEYRYSILIHGSW